MQNISAFEGSEFYQNIDFENEAVETSELQDGKQKPKVYTHEDNPVEAELWKAVVKAQKAVKAGLITPQNLMLSVVPLMRKMCKNAVKILSCSDEEKDSLYHDMMATAEYDVMVAAQKFHSRVGFFGYSKDVITGAISKTRNEHFNTGRCHREIMTFVSQCKAEGWTPTISQIKEEMDYQKVSVSVDEICKVMKRVDSAEGKGDLGEATHWGREEMDEENLSGETCAASIDNVCGKNKQMAEVAKMFVIMGYTRNKIASTIGKDPVRVWQIMDSFWKKVKALDVESDDRTILHDYIKGCELNRVDE